MAKSNAKYRTYTDFAVVKSSQCQMTLNYCRMRF